jgi:uncharacterized repeat protein (TIGR02543 family)
MKNIIRFLGIIALAAVIGFTACSSGGSGGGGNYRGNPGTPGIPPSPPQATQYTVTFNINGGSGTTPEERTVNAGSDITLPGENGFSLSGHTFDGWNTEADGTGYNYSADAFYTVTGDITLYANWITVPAGSFTVTFDSNGGSSVATQIINAGNTAASLVIPTRSGYIFDNWYSDPGLTTMYNFSTPVTSNITLYAKWTAAAVTQYTITFNINGGTGTTPATQTINAGAGLTLPAGSGFSRSGYTFGGWNTQASGTGTNYSAGASYTPTGDITLYAKWTAAAVTQYTITFNINGGTGTTPATQTINAGASLTLPADSGFSRSGYTFGGWNTQASGTGTNYSAGASYTPTGNITLYARWTAVAYTITFNINSGTGTTPAAQTINAGAGLTLPAGSGFSRSSYTFGGWNTQASGTGTNYNAGAFYTPAGNITLYARWTVNTAGVTLDVGQIIDGAPIINSITISRTGSGGLPVTQLVSVENPSQYSSIRWEFAGVGAYANQTIIRSGSSFTLDAGDVRYNSPGGHVLKLTVTKNGQQYQRAIPFTIVP